MDPLGTITEGERAIFGFNAVTRTLKGSSFTCPETEVWATTYALTTPASTTLAVEAS
jgi:hypothetical protein